MGGQQGGRGAVETGQGRRDYGLICSPQVKLISSFQLKS